MAIVKQKYDFEYPNQSAEFYFSAFVEAAFKSGMITEARVEQLQIECMQLLKIKCERQTEGQSSSLPVDEIKNIMHSNLYTLGIYLKSIINRDLALERLKNLTIFQLYEKGIKIIETKIQAATLIYNRVRKNRIKTDHYTYNATLGKKGIVEFFKDYRPDYGAHENQGSVDYQLFKSIEALSGVEFVMQYLSNLYLENKFCGYFESNRIARLLYNYDRGYKDTLINIFEQVFIGALGCVLTGQFAKTLYLEDTAVRNLQVRFKKMDQTAVSKEIDQATVHLINELGIKSHGLKKYLDESLSEMKAQIFNALSLDTLDKLFIAAKHTKKPNEITFSYSEKMERSYYREFIEELNDCRYFSDKKILIQDYIKSLGDFEAMLLDSHFSEAEMVNLLGLLSGSEIAILVKQYRVDSDTIALTLSDAERCIQRGLKGYLDTLDQETYLKIRAVSKNISLEEV